jgi:LPS export ABC transporter protein LptC
MKMHFGLFVVFTFIFICSCAEKKQAQKNKNSQTTPSTKLLPDQISYDVVVKFVDSSFTKAVLKANRARVYQDRFETILDSGVQVEFMSRTSYRRMSLLTADSVRIDDRTKNMLAGGNVHVYSDSTHTTLETTLLEWNNKTQKLYSTEFVKIKSPMERIQGTGFESDQYLNNYTIFRPSGEQR